MNYSNYLATDDLEQKYSTFINPQWPKLLKALGLNRSFIKAEGSKLYTNDGICYLDFLSGYGVYNIGHNHPTIINALIDQLHSSSPSMLQSHLPPLAAELAQKLCYLAGGKLNRVLFTNSGSEGIETAIKFSRAYTKRDKILYAKGGFHGLTCGALSLMSNPWWSSGFGPLLPGTQGIPFDNLTVLKQTLSCNHFAAFIVEPIQGEAGVIVPNQQYLKEAQSLCEKHGTLLVLDEVQTGLYRTGHFLAADYFDIEPDMVILAKALSGGLVPVGAVLMRKDISDTIFYSIEKAFVHSSTFAENSLAMRAGLATLEILEQEKLGQRAIELGQSFRLQISKLINKYEMIKEVRGVGLFNAIEFQPPQSLALSLLYKTFTAVHQSLFGQMIVKTLFEEHKILSQLAGNNYQTLKLIPPLNIAEQDLEKLTVALDTTFEMVEHNRTKFWSQGLQIASHAL